MSLLYRSLSQTKLGLVKHKVVYLEIILLLASKMTQNVKALAFKSDNLRLIFMIKRVE